MRILYVDQNVDLARNARNKLAKLGHNAHAATNLDDAMEILSSKENKIELLVADHNLPEGEGLDTLMGLKAAYPDVKVCVITSAISRSQENQLAMVEIPVFKKPILLGKLVEHFRKPPPPIKKKVTVDS